MIVQYSITADVWTPISTAGQSGTCWLDEQGDGAAGNVDVRIWHGESAPGDSQITMAKRVYMPRGNQDIMQISADSGDDVYYARCANDGDAATLSVDVI